MRRVFFSILLVASLLSAHVQYGGGLSSVRHLARVTFTCANSRDCDWSGTLIVRRRGSSAIERIRLQSPFVEIGVAEIGTTDLEVELEAEGLWMPPQNVAVVSGGSFALGVWRTTPLRGRLAVRDRTQGLPESLLIEVESPPGSVGATIGRGTTFECKVSPNGSFGCVVPATSLDVVMRAKTFIPEYRWDVRLKPDAPTDLGTTVLKEGASVVAWLDRGSAKALKQPATARLVRMTMARSPTLGDRLNQPAAEGMFNGRGFVQLRPVAPGTYTLEITAAGFAPVRLDQIEVYERSESALRSAIKLEPPVSIRLALDPPRDPSGMPWRLRVDLRNPFTFRVSPVAEGAADENGKFEVQGQAPGRYSVRVSDPHDNVYAWHDLLIHHEAGSEHLIKIGFLQIRGKVSAGNQPVATSLLFGGHSGSERITATTADDGVFQVVLPRGGDWTVDVGNEQEGVIAAVHVTIADGEDELKIDLPDTEISGRVIGPDGERVPGALVNLQTAAGTVNRRATADGTFRFRWVSPGNAMINARDTRTSEQSKYVQMVIAEGEHRNDLELATQNTRAVKATVVSQGQPVVGARVTGYGFGTGMARQERAVTGLDGGFELPFPVSAREIALIVAAPGRTMQAFSTPPTDAKLTLDVATTGGILRLTKIPGTSRPGVTYNGTPIPLPELLDWAHAQGADTHAEPLDIPNVAPGVYRLCAFRDAEKVCREGTLAQGSILTLGGE